MKEYILLFRHPNPEGVVSAAQISAWMEETRQWVESLLAEGRFVSGVGILFDEAKVVHFGGKVTDGPFGREAATIGGYVTVKAESMAEATGFASRCPILSAEGNTVEVRPLSAAANA